MKKIAFVTASSGAFGFAIALDLSKKDYIIVLNGRDRVKLEKAKERLCNKELHYIFCFDLTKENLQSELDSFFTLHNLLPNVIIHSLGGKISGDEHPINLDVLSQTMHLNLNISIVINNYFIEKFKDLQEIRKIIHISSSASTTGNASPCYVMSKAALNVYVKNMARRYALEKIMICAILPNIIMHETSDWKDKELNNPEYFNKRVQETPLKEFSRPQQLVPYISAVCEIDSMYATGSLINLQGGV